MKIFTKSHKNAVFFKFLMKSIHALNSLENIRQFYFCLANFYLINKKIKQTGGE